MTKRVRTAGFTFAEVLVAMVFAAILVPVAVHGIAVANRAAAVADGKRTAARLADNMLNELVVTGDWIDAEVTGDFGDERAGYRWEMQDETWEHEESLSVVSIEVFFQRQGREFSVRLSTLAPGEEVE